MSSPAGQPAKKHSLTIPDRSPGSHPAAAPPPHTPTQDPFGDFSPKTQGREI
jgi:hypothetical protein